MLVYGYFAGDEVALARLQHDRYGEALAIIVSNCRALTHSKYDRFFDQRTLQVAHDILAAAWRHQSITAKTSKDMSCWLDWLRGEVQSWVDHPRLIFAISDILLNQNCAVGYEAEDRLRCALLDRFSSIPLHQSTADRRQW